MNARETIENLWDRATPVAALLDAYRAEVLAEGLNASERQFLTFALELAADQMASRGDEFDDEDEAALEVLRRMAVLADHAAVPRTERSHWVSIADALNAADAAGMPVGIDLDGTLTDHRAWSVVWDRQAERWVLAGYDEDGMDNADFFSASELYEMDRADEFRFDAEDDARDGGDA